MVIEVITNPVDSHRYQFIKTTSQIMSVEQVGGSQEPCKIIDNGTHYFVQTPHWETNPERVLITVDIEPSFPVK